MFSHCRRAWRVLLHDSFVPDSRLFCCRLMSCVHARRNMIAHCNGIGLYIHIVKSTSDTVDKGAWHHNTRSRSPSLSFVFIFYGKTFKASNNLHFFDVYAVATDAVRLLLSLILLPSLLPRLKLITPIYWCSTYVRTYRAHLPPPGISATLECLHFLRRKYTVRCVHLVGINSSAQMS